MLIDSSYFTSGPRQIQNATLGGITPNIREVAKAIDGYISFYQSEFLTKMLGDRFGSEIQLYLAEQDSTTSEDDLIEEYSGNEEYDEICERLKESFADYVFYQILRDSSTTATITGLVVLKSANRPVSPLLRQISVWNDMVNKNRAFKRWLIDKHGKEWDNVAESMLRFINALDI